MKPRSTRQLSSSWRTIRSGGDTPRRMPTARRRSPSSASSDPRRPGPVCSVTSPTRSTRFSTCWPPSNACFDRSKPHSPTSEPSPAPDLIRTRSELQQESKRPLPRAESSALRPFFGGRRTPFGVSRDHSAAGLLLYSSQISTNLLQVVVETASVFVSRLPNFLKDGIGTPHSKPPRSSSGVHITGHSSPKLAIIRATSDFIVALLIWRKFHVSR